jgi:hypothetical protein
MCAGHPNQVTPDGLRNLPFFLYMGGDDTAYHRNTVVREFNAKLDGLQSADPAGYLHRMTVYDGFGHNMMGREAEAIPRMASFRRVAWPRKVVWKQDDVVHTRFYWLERPLDAVRPYQVFTARVDGQTVTIEAPDSGNMTLRLSDELLDLEQPVRVVAGGRTLFDGKVERSFDAILKSLREREDPGTVACALLPVTW